MSTAVTCLAPGPTDTGFVEAAGAEASRFFALSAMRSWSVAEAGYRGFRRGRVLVIPGWRNRAVPLGGRVAPRWLTRRVAAWLNTRWMQGGSGTASRGRP